MRNNTPQFQRQHQQSGAHMQRGNRYYANQYSRPTRRIGQTEDRIVSTTAGIAIGGSIAGPVGAVVGGVIGYIIP